MRINKYNLVTANTWCDGLGLLRHYHSMLVHRDFNFRKQQPDTIPCKLWSDNMIYIDPVCAIFSSRHPGCCKRRHSHLKQQIYQLIINI